MAKKKAAVAKDVPLNEMSVTELQARLSEKQESSFRLRFRHASSPLKNPMEIRTARREIARLKTLLNQKQREAV